MKNTNLIGLSRQELEDLCLQYGQKPFRARQLWHWIYYRGASDFSEMTSLAKDFRQLLAENFQIHRPRVTSYQLAQDKTAKWLLEHSDGHETETVFIPEKDRGAVCLSSQVGCNMGCRFCYTGTQKCVRNLTSGEIVGQFMTVRDTYKEWPLPNADNIRLTSNVVMMGMGEPLQNYKNVAKALKILTDPEGICISRRRVTLSTCGIAPLMMKCVKELGVQLAISLHAPDDDIRSLIMPINKRYPIKDIITECHKCQNIHNARRITFEYVMLDTLNDQPSHAKALIKLVKGLSCKFNLIPFNPWPGSPFQPSSSNTIKKFAEILNNAGYTAIIRATRGQDIMAACGQLKSQSQRKTPKPYSPPLDNHS